MASRRACLRAPPFIDPPGYARHRPEATLLYELVERHYPELVGCGARRMTDSAALLADEVLPANPLRQWVLSLPFALRFLLATDREALTHVLCIAYRTISVYILKKAGLTRATGATGAVTLIHRFGSALNLNIHFHMLVLDGAYRVGTEPPVFRRIAAPSEAELQALVKRIAEDIGRALERQGVLVRDAENSFLELDPAGGGPLDDLIGHSITYRIAVGPRAGQKIFTLQSVPAREEEPRKGVAQYAGFSLHASGSSPSANRRNGRRTAS